MQVVTINAWNRIAVATRMEHVNGLDFFMAGLQGSPEGENQRLLTDPHNGPFWRLCIKCAFWRQGAILAGTVVGDGKLITHSFD